MPKAFDQAVTFLKVGDLERSAAFYGRTLGLKQVLDQGDCLVFRVSAGAFLGICERQDVGASDGVIVTLVTDDVDGWHRALEAAQVPCVSPPRHRPEYGIYQAFYRDPDNHLIEIQRFDDPRWAEAT